MPGLQLLPKSDAASRISLPILGNTRFFVENYIFFTLQYQGVVKNQLKK